MISAFVKKTAQGTSALAVAVAKSTREPERAAYVIAAGLNIAASFSGNASLKRATKPLLMPLLTGRVLRSSNPGRALGLVGLAGGWFGDLVLMRPNQLPKGAAGFAVNHLAYCTLLIQRGARPHLRSALIRTIPLVAATGLAARKQPVLAPVVLGYGALLATTSTLADASFLTNQADLQSPVAPELYGLSHGGNLFLLSDAVLCVRELLPVGENADSQGLGRIADGIVMGTYTLAQVLLIDGLFQQNH